MQAGFLNKLNSEIILEDYEPPEPRDNEVTIEQKYTGVCFRDILTQQGFFPRVSLPVIPGHEIGGIIIKKGKNITNFNIGDRVSSLIYVPCGKCEFCLSGNENLCPNKVAYGEGRNGGYSRYVNADERSLVKVPPEVPEETVPIAACVIAMLYHAIGRVGKIKKGDYVLITGAGGGVGVHAVQMVKALGGHPIAETGSKWKEEELYKLGAEYVVSPEREYNKDVKEITGQGADIVLEDVGIATFSKSLRSLKTGGRLVVIGNLKPEPVELPLGLIILKGNSIKGSISSTREDLKKALELSKSQISPVIGNKIELQDINNGYANMLDRKVLGRLLIKF
ncbi:putative alcohol dehydrogenase [Ferroplasma acidiphilum]|uniref:Putative alcohol dehydrogenase n=1 Tax=Ferroplasma acidiphilum TaxID=74969 RepID=A0A1V0N1E8_9ARCH|nr:alcohol dehydrogenase catalytic domain-containing protein [Ferroplasma acidiphilum]ARD83943.1 putative alcohol dehydrogenase [Ferroplasma acidiphilum]